MKAPKTRKVFWKAIASMMTSITAEFQKKKRVRAKQRLFLLPTVTFFPSLSFHNPPFPPLFSSSLPFSIALAFSFHTSLPFTPPSPSADFGLLPLPLPPLPANLFQKKGYHGERITSAHTSARAKREITQRRKNGSGVQTGRKRRESVYSNSKLTPLLW